MHGQQTTCGSRGRIQDGRFGGCVTDDAHLLQHLQTIAAAGGEGLMLHREDSLYRAERSDDLLKLKPYRRPE